MQKRSMRRALALVLALAIGATAGAATLSQAQRAETAPLQVADPGHGGSGGGG